MSAAVLNSRVMRASRSVTIPGAGQSVVRNERRDARDVEVLNCLTACGLNAATLHASRFLPVPDQPASLKRDEDGRLLACCAV